MYTAVGFQVPATTTTNNNSDNDNKLKMKRNNVIDTLLEYYGTWKWKWYE